MAGTQLQVLRSELRARLGLSAVATTSGPNIALLNSLLARAQSWLYWNYSWDNIRRAWPVPLTVGLGVYSYPTNGAAETVEQRRVVDIYLLDVAGNFLSDMREGIPPGLRGTTVNGPPTRYSQRGVGLTVWPAPDLGTYQLLIEGYKQLAPWAADTDLDTMDDDPILELAIAMGKFHYGQADAQVYIQLVNVLIGKLNDSNEYTGRINLISDVGQMRAAPTPMQQAQGAA